MDDQVTKQRIWSNANEVLNKSITFITPNIIHNITMDQKVRKLYVREEGIDCYDLGTTSPI